MSQINPKSQIVPIEDSLFCKLYIETGETGGKIIRPTTARQETFMANVVSVGPGKTIDYAEDGMPVHAPMQIHPGEDIIFHRFHGESLEIDGFKYLVLREGDVLAKMNRPKEDTYLKFAKFGDADEATVVTANIF